jgi:hypothetical protein
MSLPDALDLLRLRDDELAQVVRSLDHQPHLAELDLGPRVAVLELVVALAAWRSQPIAIRVQAIKDAAALCLARPHYSHGGSLRGLTCPNCGRARVMWRPIIGPEVPWVRCKGCSWIGKRSYLIHLARRSKP